MCDKCLQAARVQISSRLHPTHHQNDVPQIVVELSEGLTCFKHAQSNERNHQILCFLDEKAPMSGCSRPFQMTAS